ncbi:hypothetical protein KM043_016408 [Ampulex compressa]|nr:hypothetical protein KM043_016408 [Ampulex compressa]
MQCGPILNPDLASQGACIDAPSSAIERATEPCPRKIPCQEGSDCVYDTPKVGSARKRHPGAEVTLYNNSFGFMSWVVYTLCVPRDNHGATDDSGSYFYRLFPFHVVYDETAPLPTVHNAASARVRAEVRRDIDDRRGIEDIARLVVSPIQLPSYEGSWDEEGAKYGRWKKKKRTGKEGEAPSRVEVTAGYIKKKERVMGNVLSRPGQVHRPYKVKRPYELDSHSGSTINAGRFARASPKLIRDELLRTPTPRHRRRKPESEGLRDDKKGFVFRVCPTEIGRYPTTTCRQAVNLEVGGPR